MARPTRFMTELARYAEAHVRRSHQIGLRLTRGAVGLLLAGSLVLLLPQAAIGDDGRGQTLEAEPDDRDDRRDVKDDEDEREGKDEQDGTDGNGRPELGPSERPDPSNDGPAQKRSDESEVEKSAAAGSEPDRGTEEQQPASISSSRAAPAMSANEPAGVAMGAPRGPRETAVEVLDTTPASVQALDEPPLPRADIRAAQPTPAADVNAAGAIQAADLALEATPFTTTASATPSGLPIDPLVPASLGLLLLARALRRPSTDDRKIQL